jgi:glycosyltransferase involved in cell wall biosynthesis
MSCGCAVVASNEIGSVPYLIEHNQNGLIFNSGSLSSLVEQTEKILKGKSLRDQLSRNAYFTMYNEWNPREASSRFIKLANSIIDDKKISIEKGPCSVAYWTKK